MKIKIAFLQIMPGKNLEENAGSGTWLEGERFSGNVSEDELTSWIEGLELPEK